jgi:hypothetical protein
VLRRGSRGRSDGVPGTTMSSAAIISAGLTTLTPLCCRCRRPRRFVIDFAVTVPVVFVAVWRHCRHRCRRRRRRHRSPCRRRLCHWIKKLHKDLGRLEYFYGNKGVVSCDEKEGGSGIADGGATGQENPIYRKYRRKGPPNVSRGRSTLQLFCWDLGLKNTESYY